MMNGRQREGGMMDVTKAVEKIEGLSNLQLRGPMQRNFSGLIVSAGTMRLGD